jgi:hypothetical protein
VKPFARIVKKYQVDHQEHYPTVRLPYTLRKLIVSEWITLDRVFDADTMDQWWIPYDGVERQA